MVRTIDHCFQEELIAYIRCKLPLPISDVSQDLDANVASFQSPSVSSKPLYESQQRKLIRRTEAAATEAAIEESGDVGMHTPSVSSSKEVIGAKLIALIKEAGVLHEFVNGQKVLSIPASLIAQDIISVVGMSAEKLQHNIAGVLSVHFGPLSEDVYDQIIKASTTYSLGTERVSALQKAITMPRFNENDMTNPDSVIGFCLNFDDSTKKNDNLCVMPATLNLLNGNVVLELLSMYTAASKVEEAANKKFQTLCDVCGPLGACLKGSMKEQTMSVIEKYERNLLYNQDELTTAWVAMIDVRIRGEIRGDVDVLSHFSNGRHNGRCESQYLSEYAEFH